MRRLARTRSRTDAGRPDGDGRQDALRRKLGLVPRKPGVYLLKGADGEVLYVGKAKDLRSRVRSYFAPGRTPHVRIDALMGHVVDVDYLVTDSEVEALLLESNVIKEHNPRFNIELRDDKTYPYLKVTNEPYPRVVVTRRLRNDGARYFGPFTQVAAMRRNLALIQDLFRVRSCRYDLPRERPSRPCLDYFIKKCDAPCVDYVSREEYGAMMDEVLAFLSGRVDVVAERVRERMEGAAERLDFERAGLLKKQLDQLRAVEEGQRVHVAEDEDRDVIALARIGDLACGLILKVRRGRVLGKEHHVLRNLTVAGSDPAEAFGLFVTRWYLRGTDFPPELLIPFDFEDRPLVEAWLAEHASRPVRVRVPRRGEKRKLVELAERNAFLILEEETLRGAADAERAADVVRAVQRELRLPRLPRTMACFDVSTLQGADPVGACVVFENGGPRKSEYRRFRIRYVEGQDDFAMIAEIVGRWLRGRLEGGEDLPDLLVVDGGRGQLGSALGVLAELGVEDVPVVALAKQDEEIYVAGRAEPLVLPRRSEALRLLQRARDEAHRFAVAYHRHRRAARTLVSGVDAIPGVGARRRRSLLSRFGSLERVRTATAAEIAELPGFSLRGAERILAHLRGEGESEPAPVASGGTRPEPVDPVAGTGDPAPGPDDAAVEPRDAALDPGDAALEPVFDGMGRPL